MAAGGGVRRGHIAQRALEKFARFAVRSGLLANAWSGALLSITRTRLLAVSIVLRSGAGGCGRSGGGGRRIGDGFKVAVGRNCGGGFTDFVVAGLEVRGGAGLLD